MSLWQRSAEDSPEQTQVLKNKLSSKETQIAGQQSEILKQAAELAEIKSTLNETLHKLNSESSRVLSLESTLAKCKEDLRTETLASQNAAAALLGAQDKLKANHLEMRELEMTLERFSHNSDTSNARGVKLEKEKTTLEARVRELEGNLRQLSSPASAAAATPARQRGQSRRRSSSVSDTRVITLEQDLKDTRASLAQKDTELRAATAKLAQAQTDLFRAENEKLAADRRLQAEIHELQVALQEQNDDLEYMKGQQQGDGSREEELLKRIDEDEAKIAALEKLLAEAPETQALKERMRRMEQQLVAESKRALDMENRNIELVREKEEALDEVDETKAQVAQLSHALRETEVQLSVKQREMQTAGPSEEDIERLLGAIDRIRGERDNLRRDIEFLQSEARFTEEALRARIVTLENAGPSPLLQSELLRLQEQLSDVTTHGQSVLTEKNEEIRRVGRVAMASAVVIEHLRSEMGVSAQQFLRASTASESALEDTSRRLRDAELRLSVTTQSLDTLAGHRDELHAQLSNREFDWDRANTQDNLAQLADMAHTLDDVTAERDALNLQTTNLTRDLELAQREIAEGEMRFTALQFHQLSSMTTNEATEALRKQLKDQEERVLRRTELVGILQHDNERIVTNMKLQEERLAEMTGELEVLAAQKDAMVEDCAEARNARDVAIRRVEELEVDMEVLEKRAVDADSSVYAMVGVVFESVGRSRGVLRHVRARAAEEARAQSVAWERRTAELEEKRQELQAHVSSMEADHHAEIQRLAEQLALKDRMLSENDLEGEIARLKVAHVEEMGVLQARLVELTSARDETQARCEAAEEKYRQALSDSTRSKQELETATGNAAAQAEGLRAELTRVSAAHAAAVEELQTKIASALAAAKEAQAAHQELESTHERTLGELAQAKDRSAASLQELEDRAVELESQLEEQITRGDTLSEEADALRDQLQRETDAHAHERQELDTTLQAALQERADAQAVLQDLKREFSVASTELEQARAEAESVQQAKTALEEEITILQSEIQRSLSLRRYLENQVKEKEQMVDSLTDDLEQTKAQFSRADQACKAAEVNLSLQGAQHRREVSDLQRQVAVLKAQPDLKEVITSLEERNDEMEELLKQKCAELEEYDGRTIDLLKNNKKLTTKVDSLTSKVQKLQAKLEAAKTNMPVDAVLQRASPSLSTMPPPRQRSNTLSSVASTPSISSIPSVSSMSSVAVPHPVPSLPLFSPRSPVRGPSSRVVSGSSLPRPKTPERRAIPPVFRAQTPERRIVPVPPSPSAPAPILGQKRRAPDDFEDVRVPTQGFTVDSLPQGDENGTPRVRRMLSGVQSGFTPVRTSGRAAAAASSPKRTLTASRSTPYIADVTNSPRLGDTAKSKRTWLGKIRGTAQQRNAPPRTGEL